MTTGKGLRVRLPLAWVSRGPLACALWPLSLLYGAMVTGRRWLYQRGALTSWQAPVPVVVVGNVVAGGAGKTPVVMALVRHLQAQGWRPGVISRGYGRQSHGCLEVRPHMTAADCGDEPLLIRQRCGVPVFVASRRSDAAQALLAAHPQTDLLVADDGLQHHALARDINIAVFDDRGLGNGWLLPAGPLREPWHPPQAVACGLSRRLGQVDLVLHSGGQPAFDGFRATRMLASDALNAQGVHIPLAVLSHKPLMAVAGIAKPQQFFDMLAQRGLTPTRTLPLPDHHDGQGLDLLADSETVVLCTEKDAVKLFTLYPEAGDRLLAVPLVFSPEAAFFQAVDQLLALRKASRPHPLPSGHGHTTS